MMANCLHQRCRCARTPQSSNNQRFREPRIFESGVHHARFPVPQQFFRYAARARCAQVNFSPEEMVSRRLQSTSSATNLRSAGTIGVSATCITSKVYNCRTRGSEMWHGVLECSTRGPLHLAILQYGRFNRLNARSSVGAESSSMTFGVSLSEGFVPRRTLDE